MPTDMIRLMASQLVSDVRRLLDERRDAGVPLTALERTFLLAALAPRTNASADLVDELEAAIALGRRVLLGDPPAGADPAEVTRCRRRAAHRLLAAARAALDYDPNPAYDPTATAPPIDHGGRKARADVDG